MTSAENNRILRCNATFQQNDSYKLNNNVNSTVFRLKFDFGGIDVMHNYTVVSAIVV